MILFHKELYRRKQSEMENEEMGKRKLNWSILEAAASPNSSYQ